MRQSGASERALLDAAERAATAGHHDAAGRQLRHSEPRDVKRMKSWHCRVSSLALVTRRGEADHPVNESRG